MSTLFVMNLWNLSISMNICTFLCFERKMKANSIYIISLKSLWQSHTALQKILSETFDMKWILDELWKISPKYISHMFVHTLFNADDNIHLELEHYIHLSFSIKMLCYCCRHRHRHRRRCCCCRRCFTFCLCCHLISRDSLGEMWMMGISNETFITHI